MGALINRAADNWRPLFAIADHVGADWPERIRDAAAALAPRDSESIGPMLLADIKAAFDEKQTDRLASADVCEALAAIEGRPWAEWRASKGASPKVLTPNQLARLLKPFGVYPETVRIGGRTPKAYHRHQFDGSFGTATLRPRGSTNRNTATNAMKWALLALFKAQHPRPMLRFRNSKSPTTTGFVAVLRLKGGMRTPKGAKPLRSAPPSWNSTVD